MYYYSKVNKKFQKYAFLQLCVLLLQQQQQQVLLLLLLLPLILLLLLVLLSSKGISPYLPVNAFDPQNSDGLREILYMNMINNSILFIQAPTGNMYRFLGCYCSLLCPFVSSCNLFFKYTKLTKNLLLYSLLTDSKGFIEIVMVLYRRTYLIRTKWETDAVSSYYNQTHKEAVTEIYEQKFMQ